MTAKLKTGVAGLDDILMGGILDGESILVEGLPGTGKTTLGLHFVLQGVVDNQPGLIITFEEFPAQYYRDALNFGWDLKQLEKDKRLKVIMTSPQVLSQEMERPGGMLDQLTHELGVRRVLVDSINFLTFQQDQGHFRDLINRFINGFKRQGISSLLIKDVEGEDGTQWGMYSVDCYIRLQFDLIRNHQRRRLIEVFKARGQRHLYGQHPFEITENGLEVYPHSLPSQLTDITRMDEVKRIKTGVDGLDDMLRGGFFEGQTVLVAGTSGTGKTNIGLHFLAQGLSEGQTGLYLSMEEQGGHLLRHARTLGMDLEQAVKERRLTILNIPSAGISEGEFLHLLRRNLQEMRPQRLVIDPITFLNNVASSPGMVHMTFQSMIKILREWPVTTLCTSEISEVVGDFKLSEDNLSYLVDTVILLRLAEIEGTLRKAVLIIKQRGSGHDRNLRELLIDREGVRIGEPFLSHEGILNGMTRRRDGAEPAKILIVDDDPQMIELIKASFRDERVTLLSCGDGETALRMAMTEGPDLIILDLMLPKLNGFEICQRLKADSATADTPIIMLSAKGETESKVHGIKIGADDYITKPFSPQELVARVKMILRRVYSKRKIG